MSKSALLAAVAALTLSIAGPGFAHHSVSAQFDVDKVLMQKAVLAKVEWINPHPYLTFDVVEANGEAHKLALESAAPQALRRAGLPGKEALKVGQTYTVFYHPARNGKNTLGLMSAFTLPDGRTIGALSAKNLVQIQALQQKAKATN